MSNSPSFSSFGPTVVAGLMTALNIIVINVSLAVLIFSGPLTEFVSTGITFILFGSVLGLIITGLISSYGGMIAFGEDIPAAIMALIAAGFVTYFDGQVPAAQLFVTVVAAMLLVSITTGLLLITLGYFKLGDLFRFLPYPVVGGFLAGTGWLLASGGMGVMIPLPKSTADLISLFDPGNLVRWLPGIVFAFLLYFIVSRWRHFLVFPSVLAVAAAGFYLFVWIIGVPLGDLMANGYLLGPFPEQSGEFVVWQAVSLEAFAGIEWGAMADQAGSGLGLIALSIIAMLLSASGIELVVEKELDLNRELIAAGLGTLGSGSVGGLVSYHWVSITTLGHSLGGRGRLLPLISAAVSLIFVLLGPSILASLPKFVFGGVLTYLGLGLLIEWVVQSRKRFNKLEYFILLVILLTIAAVGFLQGVILGLFLAVGLFIYNYSRVSVVKHALTGREYASRVTRPPEHGQILAEKGGQILIFQLDGYLFFGTANSLLERVRHEIESQPVRFLVLDFKRVSGLDSTVGLIFTKLVKLLISKGITVLLAPPPDPAVTDKTMTELLAELAQQNKEALFSFDDLDKGVEWCENQLLKEAGQKIDEHSHTLRDFLRPILPDDLEFETVFPVFERDEVAAGYYLIEQGASADAMFFIEAGQVTAQLELPGRRPVRLETMRGGHIVGEIGFFLDRPRSAAVVTDEPTIFYRLTKDALTRLTERDPRTAAAIYQTFLQLVSGRQSHLIATVNALQR